MYLTSKKSREIFDAIRQYFLGGVVNYGTMEVEFGVTTDNETLGGSGVQGDPLEVTVARNLIGSLAHGRLDQPPGDEWLLENGVVIDDAVYPEYAQIAASRAPAGGSKLRVIGSELWMTTGGGYPVIFKTSDGATYSRVATPYDHTYTPDGDGYATGWSFRAMASFGDVIIVTTSDDDDAAAIMRSDDAGATWEIISVDPDSQGTPLAVAFNDDGSMLVLAALQDAATHIWTSDDQGLTWTEGASLTVDGDPVSINAIIFHDNLWVMPAANGDGLDSVFTAADPTGVWTENDTPIVEAFARWNGGVSNGTVIVAVGSEDQGGAAGVIMSSPDGLTWTKRLDGTAGSFTGVDWSVPLALFVAAGTSGLLYTSPDGITWTVRVSGAGALAPVAAFGAKFFAFDTTANGMITSTNGTAWTAVPDFDPQAYYTPAVEPIGDNNDIYQFVRVLP